MTSFKSIKELLKTLDWAKDLLDEMFHKRNEFSYKYDMAVEMLDSIEKTDRLIELEIIRRNGVFVELDEKFMNFFELVLEVNEQISTAFILDNIHLVKESINYYLKESNTDKQYSYLKQVKSTLQKTGRITARSIVDLNRNIENTFKTETNFKIKLEKLQNLKQKKEDIQLLVEHTDKLITDDEQTFFKTALDEELKQITFSLRLKLTEARHNIIETHEQIIDYINQTKYKTQLLEKIKQLKYLKDQFDLKSKTNIEKVAAQQNALVFEPRSYFSTKLSLVHLQTDEANESIFKTRKKIKSDKRPRYQLSESISSDYLNTEPEHEIFINMEEVINSFSASGNNLYDFVMSYKFPKEQSFDERVTLYCQLVSMYETDLKITGEYQRKDDIEFAMIYPK